MKKTTYIFNALKDRNECTNASDFSVKWLNMSYYYFNTVRDGCSVEALLNLWRNLARSRHADLAGDVLVMLMETPPKPLSSKRHRDRLPRDLEHTNA